MGDVSTKILPCPMCESKSVDCEAFGTATFCGDCGFSYDLDDRSKSIDGWNNLGCRKRITELTETVQSSLKVIEMTATDYHNEKERAFALENRIAIRDKLLAQLGEKYDELEILYSSSSDELLKKLQASIQFSMEQATSCEKPTGAGQIANVIADYYRREGIAIFCEELLKEISGGD